LLAIRHVDLEGHLVADALLDTLGRDTPRVDAVREVVQLAAERRAQRALQALAWRSSDVADRVERVARQRLFGRLANTPEGRDGKRVQELQCLRRRDHEKPVGL